MRDTTTAPNTFRLLLDMSGAAERPEALALIEWMLSLVNRHDSPTSRLRGNLREMERMPRGTKSDDLSKTLDDTNRLIGEIRLPLAAVHGNRNGELPEGLRADIADRFRSGVSVSPDFGADSAQFMLRVEWDINSSRSRAYVALALLAASRELRSRLGRCALSECGIYFLDDVSRGGKPRLFCSVKHSDIGRTRQYRERLKAQHAKSRKHK